MDVCKPNRTAPVSEAVPRRDLPLCSRTNGWSWPPHPFQLLAWLLYLFFAVTGFGVFVPLLPSHWIPAGYICTGITFVCHLFVHLMAVSIDPADFNVRAKSYHGPVPVFDRTKHAHVIENCHCYLCEVDVLFLNSVISALLGVFLVGVIASYIFIEFFLDPSKLRSDKHFQVNNETVVWFVFLPVAPVSTAGPAIPVLAGITIALGLLSALLLGHLLCFHFYLMWNRLNTYEYIVRQRHRQEPRDISKGVQGNQAAPPKTNLMKDVSYSGTLGYANPEMDVEDPTTMAAARGGLEYYGNGRVHSSSSRMAEEEQLPSVSTEHRAAAPRKHIQKKKKKVHKVPAEVINDRSTETSSTRDPAFNTTEPVESCSVTPVPTSVSHLSSSLSQHLPFPLRASLPPPSSLQPGLQPGPVLPAGPPAEYHSDSAESLEEIPVALARLGTSATAGTSTGRTAAAGSSQRSVLLPAARPHPSPQPRTKRKTSTYSSRTGGGGEQRFEMAAQPPTVYVSRSSGQPGGGAQHRDIKRSSRQASRRGLEQPGPGPSSNHSSRAGTPMA
ncbi:probable palmitoyltransferase ZDHHC1 isoform X3 [Salmo trutta]|uniref:Zinc finger DHHC-type containing 1 n=1 Tax=Salmo trutta TaxID=8032 RepID=A0A673YI24_SALTR|nr:probable palmitoyltransferase ZDHHC1 isoform X3 [Salmo trutta]